MSARINTKNYVFIDLLWSDPRNRSDKEEEDHYLYFDPESLEFKVVENVEHTSGPDTSLFDSESLLRDYLGLHPKRLEKARAAILERLRRDSKPAEPVEG